MRRGLAAAQDLFPVGGRAASRHLDRDHRAVERDEPSAPLHEGEERRQVGASEVNLRVRFQLLRVQALYPETVDIDLDAAKRVEQALIAGGLVKPGASISGLHDTTIVGG